ncbi:MAG: SPOR domain-containing protein [Proteobacteria bacterium]|nr:SPOR domain-containing protein [Pseudomonadota bacterium]
MIKAFLSFVILLTLTTSAARADFEQDLAATAQINTALRELRARAAAGDADAQLKMGGIFFKGREVEQDYAESEKWFRLAARQGLPQAQFNLGMLYDTGQGVSQDHTEAAKWYRLAAVQGLALAQLNLGVACATGQGVLKNEQDAAKWTRLAADQGEIQAQFNLAVMYANGQGVKQNFIEAYRWAQRSSAQGHETARLLARDLSGRITAEQQAGKLAETPQQTSNAGVYYLQLAAFKSQREAESYLTDMRVKLGHIDKPFSIFTSDGWVRTQLGPYPSLEEARLSAANLKSSLGYQPLLKRH